METIGRRVMRIRVVAGMQKQQLAILAKCHPHTVTALESDRGINMFTFIEIARVLNVSIDYLVHGGNYGNYGNHISG
jgi:DNA-binding XRE family transcriptional regulator